MNQNAIEAASAMRGKILVYSLITAVCEPLVEKYFNYKPTVQDMADVMALLVFAWHSFACFYEKRFPTKVAILSTVPQQPTQEKTP